MKQATGLLISALLVTLLIPSNSFAKEIGTLIFDGNNWPHIVISRFSWSYATSVNEKKIKPLSESLREQLFSSKTVNPFKVVYSDIYRPENIRKIRKLTQNKCPFHGLKLIDLDNNPETTEWLIISQEQCLYDQDKPVKGLQYTSDDYYSNSSTGQHNWILQKDIKGRYQVIIESDHRLWIYGKDSRYKTNTLRTALLLGRINRTNKTLCGAAEIIWQYKEGQLYPVKAKADAIGCGFYFRKIRSTALIPTEFKPSGDILNHNISEEDWVFYRKLPHVQKQADRLLVYLQKVLSGEQPELLAKDLLLDEYPPKTDFIGYRKSHKTDKQSKGQETQAGQFSTEEMKALEQLLSQ